MHLNPGYRVKGVGTGSGREGRSVNLSPPGQKTGEGPRRCWSEGILAREKKKKSHRRRGGRDPERKKSRQVIMKGADLKESTRASETGASGLEGGVVSAGPGESPPLGGRNPGEGKGVPVVP